MNAKELKDFLNKYSDYVLENIDIYYYDISLKDRNIIYHKITNVFIDEDKDLILDNS